MRVVRHALVIVSALALSSRADEPQSFARLFAEPGMGLSRPEDRARIVASMQGIENERRNRARAKAAALGLLLRRQMPDGRIEEIADFSGEKPLYFTTHNASAAISTGANIIRDTRSLDGNGITIGMWDGGWGLAGHNEFDEGTTVSRMIIRDSFSVPADHATHVGGTLIASGMDAAARGMAPAAIVHSYDWNNDISEMTSRAATASGQADRIYLSNHSYGFVSGWNYLGGTSPSPLWEWTDSNATAGSVDPDFGRYNTYAESQDLIAYNAPYYLIFRSAGNDRNNNPTAGQLVEIDNAVVAYNASLHPAGDGSYRSGFDTISHAAIAKNVLTVGAVNDAVKNGARDVASATMTSFSSWGPTDDGRIKPDLVANGSNLKSAISANETAYASNYSGTSMSSPNAAGSAALLIQQYRSLFSGQNMRSSTLKGLLIHTADDRGNPGPDYTYGWGLVNAIAAANLIEQHHDTPLAPTIIENNLATTVTSRTHSFTWDGVSPIRATLCWTDPAGNYNDSVSDLRTAALVHDLNLKIIAPGGAEHLPYVMPFVGDWSQASMSAHATTGVNHTDNVEQVLVAAPSAIGIYQAVVSYTGALTAATIQNYSLILSGVGPLPPSVAGVTPDAATPGAVPLTISGSSFDTGASVKLTLSGHPDVIPSIISVSQTSIQCSLNTSGMPFGTWDVVVTNPDNQSGTLPSGFAVIGTLWNSGIDAGAPGWTTNANNGNTQWALVDTQSHSPSSAWFAAATAAKNIDNLVSEPIPIPADATNLQLSFWHQFNLESGNDGGVLELTINNGVNWFRVENSGSAEEIIAGKYNLVMNNPGGNPNNENDFAESFAWTGTNGGAFTEVIVALKDAGKYAGQSLRVRWRLGTNNSVASPGGWFVDSLKLSGFGTYPNQPPVITTAPSASPSPVTDVSTILSVTGTDDGGEEALTYTWVASAEIPENTVTFSNNGNNGAKSTTATFSAAGNYVFEVTVEDSSGASVTDSVAVVVTQTATDITLDPVVAEVTFGNTLAITANVWDQFGDPLSSPTELLWTTSGGGSFISPGVFHAQQAGGPYAITASIGSVQKSASITVNKAPASIQVSTLSQIQDGFPKPVTIETTPSGLNVVTTYNNSPDVPIAAGTYEVLTTINEQNYEGTATAILVISPGNDWTSWRDEHFSGMQQNAGLAAETADPDADGLSNLAEYALNTDPHEFTPPLTASLDSNGLSLTFTRPADLPGITYAAESSDGFGTWSSVLLELLVDGDPQTWRARDPLAVGDPLRRFLRLKFVRK